MVLRMAAGDLNAYVDWYCSEIAERNCSVKQGFSLGRAHETNKMNGAVLPVLMLGILVMILMGSSLLIASEKGPGSMHAPVWLALIGGIVFGALAQKTRILQEVSVILC